MICAHFQVVSPIETPVMRVCARCGEARDARFFGGSRHRLCLGCREARKTELCAAASERERRLRVEFPEEARAADRKAYLRKREACIARAQAWRAANPEQFRAIQKRWRERHPEQVREFARVGGRQRRARLMGARGRLTARDEAGIWAAQRGRCGYCRQRVARPAAHLDHIVPLAAGGAHDRRNVQFLCAPCNLRKGARDPVDFARSMGLLV